MKLALKKSSYHGARVTASKHLLYGEDVLHKLINLSFEEILKYMEEHNYKESIDETFTRYEGFYLIERLLNDHAGRIYSKIIRTAPPKNRDFYELYYLKYQIHNLVVYIRCTLAKEENYRAYLIGDESKKERFSKAFGMELKDGVRYLCSKLQLDANEVLERIDDLFALENYLYFSYYELLSKVTLKYNNKDEKLFVKYLKQYVDLLNARTFLKLAAEKKTDSFTDLFLLGGSISHKQFAQLATQDFAACKQEVHTLIGTDDELDETINAHKRKSEAYFASIRFSSPFTALKFLFAMEKETAQLRVLLKAKYSGFATEEIAKLIGVHA